MGWYEQRVLPRLVECSLGSGQCHKQRAQVTRGLRGTVLEIGFGSGMNLEHYPSEVERVLAVDPAQAGRELARARIERASAVVEFVGLDGQQLTLQDSSVDAVLSTWTLCTIPDAVRALREARRVLKPGGALHFLEHGLAPDAAVARWQSRLNPLQRCVGGGCTLDRPIDRLVGEGGFRIVQLDTFYMRKTPRVFGYTFRGVASAA